MLNYPYYSILADEARTGSGEQQKVNPGFQGRTISDPIIRRGLDHAHQVGHEAKVTEGRPKHDGWMDGFIHPGHE